jgi:hypothetical protein
MWIAVILYFLGFIKFASEQDMDQTRTYGWPVIVANSLLWPLIVVLIGPLWIYERTVKGAH